MTADLATIFGALQRHHVATPDTPLPPRAPGVAYIWAHDGIYKRGTNEHLDLLVRYAATPPVPGLARLVAGVRWKGMHDRLPGSYLVSMLQDARCCGTGGQIGTPVEQQYFIALCDAEPQILRPRQQASAAHVAYQVPTFPVLCDIHSHHWMPAYFSDTDDRDDQGLSVSVVIGRIFDRPELLCRFNVYGLQREVPALTVFDDLGPFTDEYVPGALND